MRQQGQAKFLVALSFMLLSYPRALPASRSDLCAKLKDRQRKLQTNLTCLAISQSHASVLYYNESAHFISNLEYFLVSLNPPNQRFNNRKSTINLITSHLFFHLSQTAPYNIQHLSLIMNNLPCLNPIIR